MGSSVLIHGYPTGPTSHAPPVAQLHPPLAQARFGSASGRANFDPSKATSTPRK